MIIGPDYLVDKNYGFWPKLLSDKNDGYRPRLQRW